MTTYAAHLDNFNDIADAVRECATLASDIADSFSLRTDPTHQNAAKRFDRFQEKYAAALHHGIGSEDNARKLLRDAVNLVYELGMQASTGAMRQDLAHRASDVMKEFKPNYTRNYGLEVGDRVRIEAFSQSVTGEIIGLDGWDNNAGIMRTDDGREMKIVCEWCERLDAYEGPERSPAPRAP